MNVEAVTKYFGISTSALETLIILAIGSAIVGVLLVNYWRILLTGALGISFVTVLASHNSDSIFDPKAAVTEVQNALQTEKQIFWSDCMSIVGNTKSYCQEVWADRQPDEDSKS